VLLTSANAGAVVTRDGGKPRPYRGHAVADLVGHRMRSAVTVSATLALVSNKRMNLTKPRARW
jgi:hypothetical protein